jgi:hypothetical protein
VKTKNPNHPSSSSKSNRTYGHVNDDMKNHTSNHKHKSETLCGLSPFVVLLLLVGGGVVGSDSDSGREMQWLIHRDVPVLRVTCSSQHAENQRVNGDPRTVER